MEDELALELDDNPTVKTTFSVLHRILFPLLETCHRRFAPSRRAQGRERIPVLPHLFALLHLPVMMLLNANAIVASNISKSRNSRPSIDFDVMGSSTDLATPTSLIHSIAIVRQPEQEHTAVLKLVFQQWKSTESGNLPRCSSEI